MGIEPVPELSGSSRHRHASDIPVSGELSRPGACCGWINGVTLATVARMVAGGMGVQSGVHFLFDAVDPTAFMAELRRTDVQEIDAWCG